MSPNPCQRPWKCLLRTQVAALILGGALTVLLATPSAHAGNVVARAGQNPTDIVVDNQPGAGASVDWSPIEGSGFGWADATRTQVQAASDGTGGSSVRYFFASANHRSDYQLWDLALDEALPSEISNALVIDFHFVLEGQMEVNGIPNTQSRAQVQWSAAVRDDTAGSSAIVVFAPGANDRDGEFLYSGDARLQGSFSESFTLQHERRSTGVLTMSVGGSAGNLALSNARLQLVGLSLAGDPPTGDGLGVQAPYTPLHPGSIGIKLLQTGELLAISPVPEPQTWLLWLSGALMLGWMRRRAAH